MAVGKAAEGSPKKPSLLGAIVPIVVLTLVAAGGGVLVGKQIVAAAPNPVIKAAEASAKAKLDASVGVRELSPIVTNLAAPDGAWVRLQTAIVYDKTDAKQVDVMAGEIVADTMAYIKTLTMTELQGASGLQHLREDLNERAALRSNGQVHEMIIEALVIQ
jgi:flagellar FliL protein